MVKCTVISMMGRLYYCTALFFKDTHFRSFITFSKTTITTTTTTTTTTTRRKQQKHKQHQKTHIHKNLRFKLRLTMSTGLECLNIKFMHIQRLKCADFANFDLGNQTHSPRHNLICTWNDWRVNRITRPIQGTWALMYWSVETYWRIAWKWCRAL